MRANPKATQPFLILLLLGLGLCGCQPPKPGAEISGKSSAPATQSPFASFLARNLPRLSRSKPRSNPVLAKSLATSALPTLGEANVTIGGGGYITGFAIHPTEPDLIYARTDMGGFYRWQADQRTWQPITDHFSADQSQYYGGESIALDPQNPNVVYIAAGKYLDQDPGAIFKSEDRGQSWSQPLLQLPMGGNEPKRWLGERLAVDPSNSNHVLFGSRQDGLWRSQDGGQSWSSVESLRTEADTTVGISTVVFDPQNPKTIYAAAFGDGVYQSLDGGGSWRSLKGGPTSARSLLIDPQGTLYATEQGIYRYQAGQWDHQQPPVKDPAQAIFTSLTFHPTNPQRLWASLGESGKSAIFESQDGGETWSRSRLARQNQVPWWTDFMQSQPWISSIQADPHQPGKLWLGDWYGLWQLEDVDASSPSWQNPVWGHEQTVTFDLIAPAQGPLLISGLADVDGFLHSALDQPPQQRMGLWQGGRQQTLSDTYSLAYSPQQPQFWVRAAGKRWNEIYQVALSEDGGQRWRTASSFPENTMPLRVAMSATEAKTIVVMTRKSSAFNSQDGGATWQASQGLPQQLKGPWNWSQPLAADGTVGDRFYYLDYQSDQPSKLLRSDNGGQQFQPTSAQLPATSKAVLRTVPGRPNQLWLALDEAGLYASEDGGDSFEKIPSIAHADLLAIAPPKSNAAPPNSPGIYIHGNLAQPGNGNQTAQLTETAIYHSTDGGKHWQQVNRQPIGNQPNTLAVSPQVEGLVFVGTNGRGIFYGTAAK